MWGKWLWQIPTLLLELSGFFFPLNILIPGGLNLQMQTHGYRWPSVFLIFIVNKSFPQNHECRWQQSEQCGKSQKLTTLCKSPISGGEFHWSVKSQVWEHLGARLQSSTTCPFLAPSSLWNSCVHAFILSLFSEFDLQPGPEQVLRRHWLNALWFIWDAVNWEECHRRKLRGSWWRERAV